MPTCNVCGNDDFEVESGHYYCTECSTQTQVIREEEKDVETGFGEEFRGKLFVGKSAGANRKKNVDLGTTWTTHEAYNVIICQQVKALIKMGVSPLLKDIVLQMWAFYLQKNEIAFKGEDDNSTDWEPCLGAFARKRDVQVLSGENEICYRKISLKKKIKKDKKLKAKNEKNARTGVKGKKKVDNIVEDTIGMLVEGDAPKQPDKATDATNIYKKKKVSELRPSCLAKRLQRTEGKKTLRKMIYNTREKYSEFMSLAKTLCFSYLGLLLLNEDILLCDIIRFAKEGHFPYMDSTHHLPSDMVLQDSDWLILTPGAPPNMKRIVAMSTQMATFIGLSEIPCRPLLPIAVRFIKDLGLPDELVVVVKNLLEKHPSPGPWIPSYRSRVNKTSIPMYEVEAMAHVLVAAKLVFGLDGKVERRLSKFAIKKNKEDSNSNCFVWDEWYSATKLKEEFLRSRNVPYSYLHEFALDVELIYSTYFDVIRSWTTHKTGALRNMSKSIQPQYREEMRKVFTELSPTSHNYNRLVCSASSFPLQSRLCQQISLLKNCHQYVLSQPDSNLLLKNFSSCSLSFILNHWNSMKPQRKLRHSRRLLSQSICLKSTLNSMNEPENATESLESEKVKLSNDKCSADSIDNCINLPKKRKQNSDSCSRISKRRKLGKNSKEKIHIKHKSKTDECGNELESENSKDQEHKNPKKIHKKNKSKTDEAGNNYESQSSEQQGHNNSKEKVHKRKKSQTDEAENNHESENAKEQEDKIDAAKSETDAKKKYENVNTKTKRINAAVKNSKDNAKSKTTKTSKKPKKKGKIKKSVGKKKTHGTHKKSTDKNIDQTSDPEGKSKAFSKNYWYVNKSVSKMLQAYDNLPETFKWLVRFTSGMVETTVDVLYYEVLVIERRLFKRKLKSN